jgi:hypothetical protein
MATATRQGRTLRATLCEVERGVFYATYPDCESASEADALTAYHIGTSAADAKRQIERSAGALGYDSVVWTETVDAPLFATRAKAGLSSSAAGTIPRFGG